jgi:polyhydroxybutyrate depolymerase
VRTWEGTKAVLGAMRAGIFVACALLVSACLRQAGREALSARLEERTISYRGIERGFWLLRPSDIDGTEPAPLILALHGGGGTGRGMCTLPAGLQRLVDEQGFILVCPDGVERHWNDGRGIQSWRAHAEAIEDVGFLVQLIDEVARETPVDRRRVFSAGISNGGLMSFRLACDRPDVLAGIAAVAASMPTEADCEPGMPVSVMLINGTEDPLVPWDGGDIGFGGERLGTVRATEEVFDLWSRLNGCEGQPQRFDDPDPDPTDGTRVDRTTYERCQGGSQVSLIRVKGGGHTWPGSELYLPEWIIGRVSRDLDASQAIWEFFRGLRRE